MKYSYSITFIQYTHTSPFAEQRYLSISLSPASSMGKTSVGAYGGELNSGPPYSTYALRTEPCRTLKR